MTFHDLLLVSNETTNLACFTVNTILFVLFTVFVLFFFCLNVLRKKSLSPSCVSSDSSTSASYLPLM